MPRSAGCKCRAGLSFTTWPRYNAASGAGNDADVNGDYGRSHPRRQRPTGSPADPPVSD